MSEKFEESKKSGPHAQLQKLEGKWAGTNTTWFEPDKIADQSSIHGSMRLIHGGKFLLHEYSTAFGDKEVEGMTIIGYHLGLGKYQCAWIDSFHNGSSIMFSEGSRGNEAFNVVGSYAYVTPELEQTWGWRTELEIVNENEVIFTAYNVSPEGEEVKATEIKYIRLKD